MRQTIANFGPREFSTLSMTLIRFSPPSLAASDMHYKKMPFYLGYSHSPPLS